MIKNRYGLISIALPVVIIFLFGQRSLAQSRQLKDDMEQLAVDLHAGIDRSTLSEEQKSKLRDDFRELRRARQNHERFAAMRAGRNIRATLDSGAFQPQDRQRIKQDMEAIRAAQGEPGGASRRRAFRNFDE
ncbi:MAG: hypothetical protein JO166_03890 [Deltaproteobacteria bacterium]|nr:hypothetical protein [Deltaproteobacteria bacterium]